jgi:hypothetical protein
MTLSTDPHFRIRDGGLPYWWDGGRYWVQTVGGGGSQLALLCDSESAAAAKQFSNFEDAVREARQKAAK